MESKKKLKFSFGSSEKVCSHLHDLVLKRNKINPKPYIIGFIDDHYALTWYCDSCCQKYLLPKNGVFLFHFPESAEEYNDLVYLKKLKNLDSLEAYIDKVSGFKVSEVCDNNPFLEFEKNEDSAPKYVDRNLFYSLSGLNDVEVNLLVNTTSMIPFGTEVNAKV
ncbi:hypothetical protein [Marinomonas lutimaris]|uniref:hypothetical protein n=1 Tax=Marinomonas lutimaris TaxID=2846746 RepID=UPI001CA484B5|nr:hypothetical protein [Marinomonas lutimaris]